MCAHDDENKARAIRVSPFFGDVCLLGLGITGRAVVDYFLKNPSFLNSLTIYSGEMQQATQAYCSSLPDSIIVHEGEEFISGSFDLAIVSPGIPPHSNLYRSALSAAQEVISEPELAWRISPEKWIGVTGTNGKTTVTELITALLKSAGITAWAAGNIGTPCIELVGTREPEDWIVAELSSYQLHSMEKFAPDVAVLLNITPDHLSWHGSHECYSTDKQRILANLAPNAPAILDVCLPETRDIANTLSKQGKRVIRVGSAEGLMAKQAGQIPEVAYIDADTGTLSLELTKGHFTLLHSKDVGIKGPHNLSNALAAAAAAAEIGAATEDINAGLAGFVPLPNRFEPCGEVSGITFINDSKATNIDAAIKALGAFDGDVCAGTVVAMFGGTDKGTELHELVAACEEPCKCAICYGEAGARFFTEMNTAINTVLAADFNEAFARAFELAESGDTVLLSPACASFDEFDSFEARGEQFKKNIAKLRDDGYER